MIGEPPGEYQRECFKQYSLQTDSTGKLSPALARSAREATHFSRQYAVQYKPYQLIGLELGISVATIMCRGEPTGQTRTWASDVVATAKRDLEAGEKLDGEGGFMVYGFLVPARASMEIEGLPIGLAHSLVPKNDVKQGQGLSWKDVEYSEDTQAVAVQKAMEAMFKKEFERSS